MRKSLLPTRIIEPPKKDVIRGKSIAIYVTDVGEFTLRALKERLDEHGQKINICTLYDRILRNWAAPHNLNARHAGITTRLLPAKRPPVMSAELSQLSLRPKSHKLDDIKIGSWEAKQL